MAHGQFFLKGRGLALFLFKFFKVYHFLIQKLLYHFQNWVMHLKKKGHSKLSKNESENIPQIKINYLERDLKD